MNATLVIISGSCTSIVQLMDTHVNKPFEHSKWESWMAWMKLDLATTKIGNLKQLTRKDVISCVSKAWASIKVKIIIFPELWHKQCS